MRELSKYKRIEGRLEAWQTLLQKLGCEVNYSEKGGLIRRHTKLELTLDEWKRRQVACEAANLTKRESEVLHLLKSGKSCPEIAIMLSISKRTIEKHVQNIYAKLNVSSRKELTGRGRGND